MGMEKSILALRLQKKNFEILRTGQKKNIGNNQFDQGSTFFIGAQALAGLPLLSRCVILYG